MPTATTKALSLLVLLFFVSLVHATDPCLINSIYQFGDSIADTGNLIRNGPIGASTPSPKPLPQRKHHATVFFSNGVNFAVAGSTALNSSFFTSRNLHVPATNTPLSTQLSWFKSHLRSTCHNPSCLKQSLVMMGEIGGNDYNYGFFQGKSTEEIRSYIPHVVGAIAAAAREVIRAGAVNVVVPGNFPVGCFPIYLTSFPVNDPKAYDDKGCLIRLNEFAMDHNNQLQEAISSLQKEFPGVVIVYGDYYNAFQYVLSGSVGFDKSVALKSCCGIGGGYNYDGKRQCGAVGVPVCQNPDKFISWDGVHLTQKAYRFMSKFLNYKILPQIKCGGA
ncbi:LOW QUALITY PROTEIN: GDSL esterase/lipase At5g03980 [Brassica rapa]|uniref:LOW QUALITY PROTEIN: GDSL esterase/lipase At5g03980 n=1 Tax=Brassica campestris TaxID=3711 RepID=UPI0004F1D062|nr:LOW QUALITY PROTEIN: GDSL esterase/lipase At5g03980 [Brassica rapa]